MLLILEVLRASGSLYIRYVMKMDVKASRGASSERVRASVFLHNSCGRLCEDHRSNDAHKGLCLKNKEPLHLIALGSLEMEGQ
ncbi:hypothetical protein KOW79_021342 [Hemibagrus wyckioides]|uniref:Uncharacterized protein n=1 Tax=Hemibagrus wyckioides TaxID=337641 RepID=A0A9D3N5Q1_9TELE|nr:hypothetical protein KOW79_021342 [Hemibagrus wyckioides]